MRISDWSSDVCSSDLEGVVGDIARFEHQAAVVVVELGDGNARLVVQRGEVVEGGDGGVDPVMDAVGGVGVGIAQVDAGGVAPGLVQREQAHVGRAVAGTFKAAPRSEEHTPELRALLRISYAVFYLKKKKIRNQ